MNTPMEYVVEREEAIKRYVLGQLSEDERYDIELRVLTDSDYFTELLLVEDELTDDLIWGALSNNDQERVKKLFLSIPERRNKLGLTSAIAQYLSNSEERRWEDVLREACENRVLLESLIQEDWMGLHLLALLRSSSQGPSDLASKVNANKSTVSVVLNKLIESGLVELKDLLTCTERGAETLQKIEKSTGVRLT